jgi:HNH endonuclease
VVDAEPVLVAAARRLDPPRLRRLVAYLAARLQTAVALLPAALGGAPTQPLEVGRTTRVVTAAQRAALAVRDGGCAFPGCDRPPPWCDAHHLRHWLHGGPTNLANLALLCRSLHRAVHEGGWYLHRHPNGHLTARPPHRRQPVAA